MPALGPAGNSYGARIRHHHPSASIGPTTAFVIDSDTGYLPAGSLDPFTFSGLRPMPPMFGVIVFSNDLRLLGEPVRSSLLNGSPGAA